MSELYWDEFNDSKTLDNLLEDNIYVIFNFFQKNLHIN